MINFKIIKKGLLITLIVPTIFLFVLLISTFFQEPNIQELNIVSIKDINTSFNERSPDAESDTSDDLISFDYKLINQAAFYSQLEIFGRSDIRLINFSENQ